MAAHISSPMHNLTNLLTVIIGGLTVSFAALGKAVGLLVMLPWFPWVIGCLGGLCSLIGICKSIHEWRLRIRSEQREEEAHRVRMQILRGGKEIEDGTH